ncbi:MAG: ATP-binding protein [Candidatus Bathyarchaeota archaeon]|jgi:Mg-chelatase subunit ChlI/Mg-chelatase subunit ChlD
MESIVNRGLTGLGLWYPFTAVVGQESVKTALILSAIEPAIGGVLISGPKGSGKSLIVKAFSQILPDIEQVADCPFNCNPVDPTNMCPDCLARFEGGEVLQVSESPMRIVQVPLSITEEMLVGSIDMDKAMVEGVRALRPGLLAEANQNILYIDEVNLLPDHITDSILDAAASGWNTIEREGISVQHPSRFILVGTMNPEEGELRPQILDRFGVYAHTVNFANPELKYLVLKRDEEFTSDPFGFALKHSSGVAELRDKIQEARNLLSDVKIPSETFQVIADTCSRLRVDGFRPDIVSARTAKALAAFEGRDSVSEDDVARSLELALGHRTRKSGLAPPPTPVEIRRALGRSKISLKLRLGRAIPRLGRIIEVPGEYVARLFKMALKSLVFDIAILALLAFSIIYSIDTFRVIIAPRPARLFVILSEVVVGGVIALLLKRIIDRQRREEVAVGFVDLSKMSIEAEGKLPSPEVARGTGGGTAEAEVRYRKEGDPTPDYGLKILKSIENLHKRPVISEATKLTRSVRGGGYRGGRRTRAISSSSRGRYAWYQTPKGRLSDVAIVPTLRSAALHQDELRRDTPRILIKPEDIRVKVREYHAPFSIILLVDMSLSMIESMGNIVQTIYNFHSDVYRRRDRVGLIVFKGSKAYTIQTPTRNLDLVVEKLRNVGASDFTPMASGLFEAWKVLKQEKLRSRDAIPHLIVVSDGIVNVPLDVPLSPLTRRRYTSDAQADSFDVAHLIVKEGFRVYVVNTNHSKEESEAFPVLDETRRIRLSPTQFLMELARFSKGSYIGLGPGGVREEVIEGARSG